MSRTRPKGFQHLMAVQRSPDKQAQDNLPKAGKETSLRAKGVKSFGRESDSGKILLKGQQVKTR